jgi:multidrug resistance efflux pump
MNDRFDVPLETETEATATPRRPEPDSSRQPPGRVLIGVTLAALVLVALAFNVALGQLTPYTSDASLQAPVIAIAPNVSGDVVEVGVEDNQRVAAGDLLFRIDPSLFDAALRKAEADLEAAMLNVGASAIGLGAAEAALVEAEAQRADAEAQHARVARLLDRGYATQSAFDESEARLAAARSSVSAAEARLSEARRRLGPEGQDNPQVQAALAARERAQIDLRHTRVTAPVDGVVTNTVLSVGQFAAAGARIATVIDTERAWLVAQLPENTLSGVAAADPVDIVLDVAPGRLFAGRVHSVASGVEQVVGAGLEGELPTVFERREWLRDVRRIPVRIEFDAQPSAMPVRVGAGASVAIHTADAGPMSPITTAWMWLVAYARYAF